MLPRILSLVAAFVVKRILGRRRRGDEGQSSGRRRG